MGKQGVDRIRANYERKILEEVHAFPKDALPQVLKILRSIKETMSIDQLPTEKKLRSSGLCEAWVDERTAEEIANDVRKSRILETKSKL